MHGAAQGSGAPRGEANGAYRHGLHTAEWLAYNRHIRDVLKAAREHLAELKKATDKG
ncbi:MAG: hypothetical protein H7840_15480 [Alphaproteobacteria bacterium]